MENGYSCQQMVQEQLDIHIQIYEPRHRPCTYQKLTQMEDGPKYKIKTIKFLKER